MGNMYPGVKTINPLLGGCMHDCSYCYRNDMMWRFKKEGPGKVNMWKRYHGMPRLDPNFDWKKALSGKKKTIFMDSMTDLFAENVPCADRNEIILRCRLDYPQHEYLWHTKDTAKFENVLDYPDNSILVTTIETNRDTDLISCAPRPLRRFSYLRRLRIRMAGGDSDLFPLDWDPMPRIAITVEPVMDFDLLDFISWIKLVKPDIVSIGADTGNNDLPEPSESKLVKFVEALREFVPEVRIKDNLRRLWPDAEVT